MQGKVLVYPGYASELTSLFDEVDACVHARDADDVTSYLRAHAAGSPFTVVADRLRRAPTLGRSTPRAPEPYDVIGYYRDRVRQIAQSALEAGS